MPDWSDTLANRRNGNVPGFVGKDRPLAPADTSAEPAGEQYVTDGQGGIALAPTGGANPKRFGTSALGDGVTDASAAFQAANDYLVSQGGGQIVPPPGIYPITGVVLDSYVEIVATRAAIIQRLPGATGSMITARKAVTSGTIAAGSPNLAVTDATRLVVGTIIQVRGAGGPSTNIYSTLNGALGADAFGTGSSGTTVAAVSASGWPSSGIMQVGSELIFYASKSGNNLNGIIRGYYGSPIAAHISGATVSLATHHRSEIKAVAGTAITLADNAVLGVTAATVLAGSQHVGVVGVTMDGVRPSAGSPYPLDFELLRYGYVHRIHSRLSDAGAINFDKCRDCEVLGGTYVDHGDPDNQLGATIWAIRDNRRLRIEGLGIYGTCHHGIALDDRTSTAHEDDGPNLDCIVAGNVVDIVADVSNSAIHINGSQRLKVANNIVRRAHQGITLIESQGTTPRVVQDCNLDGNTMAGCGTGLYVDASGRNYEGRNTYAGNTLDRNDLRSTLIS